MTKRIRRGIAAAVIWVCFVSAVWAGEGSLTVDLHVEDSGVQTKISGAEITIVKVGTFDAWDHSFSSPYGIETGALNGSGNTAMAKRVLTEADGAWTKSIRTGSDGLSVFTGLDPGIYIVTESSRSGKAKTYQKFAPYIITLPQEEAGELSYEVTSLPKTAVRKIPQQNHVEKTSARRNVESVNTGDESPLFALLLLLASSALALFVCVRLRGPEWRE
ncbi:MAG: hypothetical protein IIZ43_03120 [Eubacterium sp.]|nr:hypothetical protein [Eubacterium sp.]